MTGQVGSSVTFLAISESTCEKGNDFYVSDSTFLKKRSTVCESVTIYQTQMSSVLASTSSYEHTGLR